MSDPRTYMNTLFDFVHKGVAGHLGIPPLNDDGVVVRLNLVERKREIPILVSRPSTNQLVVKNPDLEFAKLVIDVYANRVHRHKNCEIKVEVFGLSYTAETLPQFTAHVQVLQEIALGAKLYRDTFLRRNP